MLQTFTCPLGHQWEAAASEQSAVCPECSRVDGSRRSLHSTLNEASTKRPVDELPPLPTPAGASAERETVVPPTSRSADWPVVPGYEIERELGRGGMGVVYRARQRTLKRTVALKMIRAGAGADPEELVRFRIEAEAVARLQHPNIVQIYEVGEWQAGNATSPMPFFSLEFVDGDNLDEQLGRRPQPARLSAELVETLARAMHYAHQRGIIHRDLKPGNILLASAPGPSSEAKELKTSDNRPAGIPKITDFGLAKRLDAQIGQTQTGVIMGTPNYMAPEQAAGEVRKISALTDVYALGAILYEMLTGRPPFLAATALETVQQVIDQEPVAPSRMQPKLPRDLETICLKCLQKDPRQRYGSALDLADDLRRFLADEPIQARPVSAGERLWRWCLRKPVVAGLSAALILVVCTGFGLVTWKWQESVGNFREAEHQRELAVGHANDAKTKQQEADTQRERAEDRELAARRFVYATRMNQLVADWERGDAASAHNHLQALIPKPGQPDVRGFEWHYFWNLCHGSRFTLYGHTHAVESVSFSADGRRLATGSRDGTVKIWDPATGKELAWHQQQGGNVHCVAFAPDGKTVAIARGVHTEVYLWDTVPGKPGTIDFDSLAQLLVVAFSPQGTLLATGSADRTVRLWDWATRKRVAELKGHTDAIRALAFSPDGKTLAAGSADGLLKVWDVVKHAELASVKAHSKGIAAVAFSRDGKVLATGSPDKTIGLWHVIEPGSIDGAGSLQRQATFLEGHAFPVAAVAFAADGKTLASGASGSKGHGELKLWDLDTRRERLALKGHAAGIRALAFSPDGKSLASGSEDGTAKLWDLPAAEHSQEKQARPPRADPTVTSIALSVDCKRLASASADGTVRLWDLGQGHEVSSLAEQPDSVWLVTAASDGRLWGVERRGRTVKLWDVGARQERAAVEASDEIAAVTLSADGTRLAAAGEMGSVQIWNWVAGGAPTTLIGHQGRVNLLAFAPDGKTLVSGSWDQTLILWDLAAKKSSNRLRLGERPTALAFSRDSKLLACSRTRTVLLWDVNQAARYAGGFAAIFGGGPIQALAFSPDGSSLAASATYGDTGEVHVWDDLLGGHPRSRAYLKSEQGAVTSLCFSVDGRQLAGGDARGVLRLWDPANLHGQANLMGHARAVLSLAFAPDGQTLATAGADFTVRLVDPVTERERARLAGHTDVVTCVAFSPDGQLLASGSIDRTVRVYDAASGRQRHILGGHSQPVRTLAFSPDGTTLATGDGIIETPGEIKLWDLSTGRERASLQGHQWLVRTLAFAADGRTLASGSDAGWWMPGEVKLWDPLAGKLLADLPGHASGVYSAAISPNGRLLATGSRDRSVKLWKVPGAPTTALEQPTLQTNHGIDAVTFSPDGRTLAVGGRNGAIQLWDPVLGQKMGTLPGTDGPVACLAFSRDGGMLAAGTDQGHLHIWRAPGREVRDLSGQTSAAPPSDLSTENEFQLARARASLARRLHRAGQAQQALDACRQAVAQLEKLTVNFAGRSAYQLELAEALGFLRYELLQPDDVPEAEKAFQQEVALRRRLVAEFPSSAEFRQGLAHALDDRAEQRVRAGLAENGTLGARVLPDQARVYSVNDPDQLAQAENHFREAASHWRQLAQETPAEPRYRRELSGTLVQLARLRDVGGDYQEAAITYQEGASQRERLVADFPSQTEYRRELASTLQSLGHFLSRRRSPEAEKTLRQALGQWEKLMTESPGQVEHWRGLKNSRHQLGIELSHRDRPKEALEVLSRAALVAQEWLLDFDRTVLDFKLWADNLDDIAVVQERLGQYAQAEAAYRGRIVILEAMDRQWDGTPGRVSEPQQLIRSDLSAAYGHLGAALIRRSAHVEAAENARLMSRTSPDSAANSYTAATLWARCVPLADKDDALSLEKRQATAAAYGGEAMTSLRQAIQQGYKDVKHMKDDPHLESLRSRDDFKKLLLEVETRTKNAGA